MSDEDLSKAKKIAREKYMHSWKKCMDRYFLRVSFSSKFLGKGHKEELDELQYRVHETEDADLIAYFKKRREEMGLKKVSVNR